MSSNGSRRLVETPKSHFVLRDSRLETLAVLILALVQGRTVNLGSMKKLGVIRRPA
ncbi:MULTISPECIES: hypothetical protein [unclassified Mesorhizobium]|uniref:hypothetical protein n=1 Tax=unclassified Mesorhizobium TaxID=325217 RepID=UPI0015E3EEFF|nr:MULTISPECIES: hypothetical protein [unclassified Mesorhizobium]MBZ9982464.1 hypothetical protein [Mesorhizobium sp. BR-1-1-8]